MKTYLSYSIDFENLFMTFFSENFKLKKKKIKKLYETFFSNVMSKTNSIIVNQTHL